MKRKFTTCAGRIALSALLCLFAPCLSAQFSGEGSGTADDPYRIYNAEQLYELHGYWSHRDWKSNVWYSLEADIDLTEWIEEHSPEEGWWPIGTEDSYFGGHFNGNGHTISGLRIDRPDSDNVGLFGCVDGECSIRDVRLLGAEINGRNNVGGIVGQILCEHSYYPSNEIDLVLCTVEESSINGVQSVGGIVGGVASGEITGIIRCTSENCQISGEKYVGGIAGSAVDYSSMISSTDIGISRCISRCKISGLEYAGGVIGYAYISSFGGGGIEECVSECRIKATNGSGGIAGFVSGSGTISGCCANVRLTGSKSGGIAGTAKGAINILKSYATGDIRGGYAGGIVGIGECDNDGYFPSVSYCYSRCLYIGGTSVAGIANVVQEPSEGFYNVSNSVAINDEMVSWGNLARVVTGGGRADNNLALDMTRMAQAGERLSVVPDDEQNGTSIGLSALKQQATYKKLGWDFTSSWDKWVIQEIESLPYRSEQTAPAHFSRPPKVGDTQISGECKENGTVRVWAGDSVYTAVTAENRWSVTVDPLRIGDIVSVSVQAEDKLPSYSELAIVEIAGNGTEDDPYLVRTADELRAVQLMRNDSAFYLMTNDIDLTEWIEENNSEDGWIAIDSCYMPFSGTFCGGGHTVKGLWGKNGGLFKRCDVAGTIKNLNVEIVSGTDSFSNREYNGGIIGRNDGLIKQCSVRGTYKGVYSVNDIKTHTGGIAGYNTGRIEQCSVSAEMKRSSYIGGIACYNAGQIVQCLLSGEVEANEAGGIACHNAGSVSLCSVLNGKVKGNTYAGGIACRNSGHVGKCRFIGEVLSEDGDTVGGIVALNGGKVTECKTKGSVSSKKKFPYGGGAYVGGIVGYNSIIGEVYDNESHITAGTAGQDILGGGGVAGINDGKITRCIATGDVVARYEAGICYGIKESSASLTKCVAANRRLDGEWPHRVLGSLAYGCEADVADNYALESMISDLTGGETMDGISKSEEELKQAELYENMGWCMDSVWGIDEGRSYPYLRVHDIEVVGIMLDVDELEMEIGDSAQILATIQPVDARNCTVLWSSSDTDVAEVTADGKISATSEGTTVIRAVSEENPRFVDSCCVIVSLKKADSVTIDRRKVELEISAVCKLKATVEPDYTADRSVAWTSDDEEVARVDADGVVTAVSVGTTMITATTNDGTELSASCTVKVIPKRVQSVSLDKKELMINKGTNERLTVIVMPEDAGDRSVTWKSSAESVVTVDSEGVVAAVSVGSAIVTVTANDGTGLSDSCMVTVYQGVESIVLNTDELVLRDNTSGYVRVESILPEDAYNRTVTWTSSDEKVVTVEPYGHECFLHTLSPGTAIITATANDGTGVSASCEVTVFRGVQSVSIDHKEFIMANGTSETFTATVLPEDATYRKVTWRSSDKSVVSVDSDGTVTALSGGWAYIYATVYDGDGAMFEGSCSVTVQSITLDDEEITVEAGSVKYLWANVMPGCDVEWSSDNEMVATVDSTGRLTALSVGTATITATTKNDVEVSASCIVNVIPKKVYSIRLNRSMLTVERGSSERLTATVYPEDAGDTSVTWTSSDESVATVDAEGIVTAVSVGTATVTAATNDGTDLSASCEVTVTPKHAKSISLDREELTMVKGASERLTATVFPEDADDRSVTWESNDEDVVTVAPDGTLTAISGGFVTITAYVNGAGLFPLSASCFVTVRSISLDVEELTLEIGDYITLSANVMPWSDVVWSSDNERVVTVDSWGTLNALSAGTAIITATTNDSINLSASCVVSVTPKLAESISLDREELTLERGASECLTATVLPSDADNRSVTWASSDEDVATVDAGGIVTAISAGTATVTATTNDGTDLSASCVVSVTPKLVQSISLDREELTMENGTSEQLTATVLPMDADDRSVTWASSDNAVVTVDAEGVVTAVSVGTATVTATTNDGTDLTASCAVTVFSTTATDEVADDSVQVYGRDGEIMIEGLPEGIRFYVYDVIGRKVYYGSDSVVRVAPRAYYLVQIEDNTYKVYVP